MAHILNREALRVVNKNDKGIVTYRKRYRKGDVVDTSYMDEVHVENLIEAGVLVASEDDLDERESATGTSPTAPPFGASTDGSGDTIVVPDAERGEVKIPADDETESVDEYSAMDYASLQKAAKDRGLNGGGSAEDLRTRLREYDASDES